MIRLLKTISFISIAVMIPIASFAQEDSQELENIYQNDSSKKGLFEEESDSRSEKPADETKLQKLQSITELETLAPFDDIAVIQKRYLPKTGRFEFFPNIGLVTNNAFFINSYFSARLAYSLTEKWAVELIGSFFFDSKNKVTEDLKEKENVRTQSLILPEMYYGADIRWTPIYGKMGLFNESIVPFDMYFSVGGGITDTNQDTNPFSLHLGLGQIFALKKWWAVRWDLSAYYYSSKTKVATSNSEQTRDDNFTDVELSIGMSFFFPEASYR